MCAAFRAPDHVGELAVAEEDKEHNGNAATKQPPLGKAPAAPAPASPPSPGNAIYVNGKGAVNRNF